MQALVLPLYRCAVLFFTKWRQNRIYTSLHASVLPLALYHRFCLFIRKNCLLFSAPSPCYGLLFFILLLFILPLILTGRVLLPLNSLSLKKLSCFSVLVLAMEVKGSICSQISRVVGTCRFVGIKVQPKIHETMCTMTSHCQIL